MFKEWEGRNEVEVSDAQLAVSLVFLIDAGKEVHSSSVGTV